MASTDTSHHPERRVLSLLSSWQSMLRGGWPVVHRIFSSTMIRQWGGNKGREHNQYQPKNLKMVTWGYSSGKRRNEVEANKNLVVVVVCGDPRFRGVVIGLPVADKSGALSWMGSSCRSPTGRFAIVFHYKSRWLAVCDASSQIPYHQSCGKQVVFGSSRFAIVWHE